MPSRWAKQSLEKNANQWDQFLETGRKSVCLYTIRRVENKNWIYNHTEVPGIQELEK